MPIFYFKKRPKDDICTHIHNATSKSAKDNVKVAFIQVHQNILLCELNKVIFSSVCE